MSGIAGLEVRMDDVRAVMDAAGSERAALFGISEGGPMTALFAATHPAHDGTSSTAPTDQFSTWTPETPWGLSREERLRRIDEFENGGRWGTRDYVSESVAGWIAPSLSEDAEFVDWCAVHADERAQARWRRFSG